VKFFIGDGGRMQMGNYTNQLTECMTNCNVCVLLVDWCRLPMMRHGMNDIKNADGV
jgi:hypothetical protein